MPSPQLVVTAVVACLLATVAGMQPAGAAEPTTPTSLWLSGPTSAYAGQTVAVDLALVTSTGTPVAGATVSVARWKDGSWQVETTAVTGDDGTGSADVVVRPKSSDNLFRAEFAGDDDLLGSVSPVVGILVVKQASTLELTGPATMVDETSATLSITWRAADGSPVPGQVRLLQGSGSGWTPVMDVGLDAAGNASVQVSPRVDTWWQAVGDEGDWYLAAASPILALDNLPPKPPVVLPAGAPLPRITLPPQTPATGLGARATISRLSDEVWRSMVGRSWHRGCPVGRSGLRLVEVNYWGYDGYRHRGELVVNAHIARRTAAAFRHHYRAGTRFRSLYRVDRFGWSHRLQGADDYASMAAGNTSAFNCRWVVGRPGRLSPHARGRALDVNPWENPYRAPHGYLPNTWWQAQSSEIAWRTPDHKVVRIFAKHGFRWTYGLTDTQHFDG